MQSALSSLSHSSWVWGHIAQPLSEGRDKAHRNERLCISSSRVSWKGRVQFPNTRLRLTWAECSFHSHLNVLCSWPSWPVLFHGSYYFLSMMYWKLPSPLLWSPLRHLSRKVLQAGISDLRLSHQRQVILQVFIIKSLATMKVCIYPNTNIEKRGK